jgi:hypothetical protein
MIPQAHPGQAQQEDAPARAEAGQGSRIDVFVIRRRPRDRRPAGTRRGGDGIAPTVKLGFL